MLKKKSAKPILLALFLLIILSAIATGLVLFGVKTPSTQDGLVFIHHSVGENWLNNSLNETLLAKDYIVKVNDITYGVKVFPDNGRPASLPMPSGDYTDMEHWLYWFNDYFDEVQSHNTPTGIYKVVAKLKDRLGIKESNGHSNFNKIVMFKSCFPNSDITGDGNEPGDPFSATRTLANYQAIYRHPDGSGHAFTHNEVTYKPLEDIFSAHPDTLFIVITAPPLHYAPADATTNDNAQRARVFNNWLKSDWLAQYNTTHPDLNNVAVFDLFNELAYAADVPAHPNRLKAEYGGDSGDSHPNSAANLHLTQIFATNPDNFLDSAWNAFDKSQQDAALASPQK